MLKKPLKIALVGTCCSGKTTIFKHLKKSHRRNPKIAFVTEAAREVLAKNPHFLKDRFSLDAQRAIVQQIIENEKIVHQMPAEVIVCDRSVIDCFVYIHSTGRKDIMETLYREASHWIPSYDKIVLFDPHEIPYVQDSVRTESPETRINLHNAYLEFFETKMISYSLLSGPKNARIKKIKNIIG